MDVKDFMRNGIVCDEILPFFSKRPYGFPVYYDQITIVARESGRFISKEHSVFRIDVVAPDRFVLNRWFVLPFGLFETAYDKRTVLVTSLTSAGDVSGFLEYGNIGYREKSPEGLELEYGFSARADNWIKGFLPLPVNEKS